MVEPMLSRAARVAASPWLAVPAAALAYGAWVAWLHRGHPDWWQPSAAHALYSALITAVFYRMSQGLWQRWQGLRHGRLRVFLSLSLLLVALPLFTQLAAGSRAPLLAILPGALIGHGYLLALVASLGEDDTAEDADAMVGAA
ncbi:MAG: hypothetical protein EA402_13365 [Planctomycetota bacterium]|nr:MAG: hypothetical protein EA402_13365 [Planctomycetota bacterium]